MMQIAGRNIACIASLKKALYVVMYTGGDRSKCSSDAQAAEYEL